MEKDNRISYVLDKLPAIHWETWDYFIALGILLLPYDALHVLPSNYRPVSIFPFAAAVVVLFVKRPSFYAPNYLKAFTVFIVYAILQSSIINGVVSPNLPALIDSVTTLVAAFVCFTVCATTLNLRARKHGPQAAVLWFTSIARVAYVVPIIVGIIEVLSLIGILPYSVKTTLNSIFGSSSDRLCYTSSEASWAASQMLIGFSVYFVSYYARRSKLDLAGMVGAICLTIMTLSAQGIITIGLSILLYAALRSYKTKSIKRFITPFCIVICAAILVYFLFIGLYDMGYKNYFTVRIAEFSNIENLLHSDASSFIRIMHPLIALHMFLSSPLIGIGGGLYSFLYPTFLTGSFPWATTFSEVNSYVTGLAEASPISLYARILCEYGLIGMILFLTFLLLILKSLLSRDRWDPYIRGVSMLVIVVLTIQLQFASFAFVPLWVALSLAACVVAPANGWSPSVPKEV